MSRAQNLNNRILMLEAENARLRKKAERVVSSLHGINRATNKQSEADARVEHYAKVRELNEELQRNV